MKRFAFLAAALLLFVAAPAQAYPVIGAMVSSGSSVNNQSTAVPFTVQPGALLFVQCNGAAYVNLFTTPSPTATATNAVQINSGQLFPLPGSSGAIYLAMLPVSGAVTCLVFVDAP